jgi:hypothetical protein
MAYWDKVTQRRANLKKAEDEGLVADSMDVRMALMEEFHAGKKTLQDVQSELKKIKENAKKSGKLTRSQAYRN